MKIIVDQNHVGSFFAYVSSILSHRNSNVSSFQGDTIVDAITRHCNYVASMLKRFDNRQFVLWRHTIEDAHVVDDFLELHLIHLIDFMTADGLLVNRVQADELSCQTKVFNAIKCLEKRSSQ